MRGDESQADNKKPDGSSAASSNDPAAVMRTGKARRMLTFCSLLGAALDADCVLIMQYCAVQAC